MRNRQTCSKGENSRLGVGSQVDSSPAAVRKGGGVGCLDGALDAVHILLIAGHNHTDVVRQLHLQPRAPDVFRRYSIQKSPYQASETCKAVSRRLMELSGLS